MKKIVYCSILFCFLFSVDFASAKIVELEFVKEKTSVGFQAKGTPSALTINGTNGKGVGSLKIEDGLLSGEISVELNDFDTGMDLRNEHMRENYLETQKVGFNASKLKLSAVTLGKDFPDKNPKVTGLELEGLLTLHGKEQKIMGKLTMNYSSPEEITGTFIFTFKLTDFGITIPYFAGITIANEIEVKSNYFIRVVPSKKE